MKKDVKTKIQKTNTDAENKEKPYTPFYYYIIRYGAFLIPCLLVLGLGIFLVSYGWKSIKAGKDVTPIESEQNEQIADNIPVVSDDTEPQSVGELQKSGDLKLSSEFAFKLRDLSQKLRNFDASTLSEDEKYKFDDVMADFETFLDTLNTKTPEEATNELTLLSARVDELIAIVDFRNSESLMNDLYNVDIPDYNDIDASDVPSDTDASKSEE